MAVAYYSERVQMETGTEKRLVGQGLGEAKHELPGVLLEGPWGWPFILPAKMCDGTHGAFPARATHLSLGVESSHWV